MDNSEITFNCRLFKDDPAIRAFKKQLTYKTLGPILLEYIVSKKLLFIVDRKYFTYKPGYFVTYEDHEQQGQLRFESWMELKKGAHILTTIAAIKNSTLEGESLKLSW